MAVTMTSIRLDTHLADEAAKVLGAKSRTEAVHAALREIVALTLRLNRFDIMMLSAIIMMTCVPLSRWMKLF